ncbi:MAG: nucleoside hydrolase, partial [Thermodesulfobacteriota bacterium]|nr:nucleoside hydrolase [Thermodesulfobacteriota bacterium]
MGTAHHQWLNPEQIIEELKKNNYNRAESIQTEIEDAYLDTKTNFLGQNDFTLRLRKVMLSGESHYILQLKKRVPSIKIGYKRTKLELPLTKDHAKNLMTQGLLPRRFEGILGFILPTRHSLQPAFHVKISRDITLFENAAEVGQRLELRIDNVVFLDSNAQDELGRHQEIEIENRSADPKQVGNLISQLEEKLQLIPVSQTKNDRGRFLIRSKQVLAKSPRRVIIDTDCGVDDALALIMALQSPELKVEAVTTVSGNVHIKKVNLNVFKVFRALALNHDNIPLVAEGAFTPLDKSFSGAPSVHGKDGLGDVPDEAPPIVKLHPMTAEEL